MAEELPVPNPVIQQEPHNHPVNARRSPNAEHSVPVMQDQEVFAGNMEVRLFASLN